MNENAAFYLELAKTRRDAARLEKDPARAKHLEDDARRYEETAARLRRLEHTSTTTRTPRDQGNKLNARTVEKIIEATARGERHANIAKRFGVHADTVSRICRGETWPHVLPGVPRGTSAHRANQTPKKT